ncbi:acyl transferase/acyl hydrolase/lysophospholipase [Apiospora marii]
MGLAQFLRLAADAAPDYVANLDTGSLSDLSMAAEVPPGYWRGGPWSRLAYDFVCWRTSWLPPLVYAYLSFLRGDGTWNHVTCLVRRAPQENDIIDSISNCKALFPSPFR